MKALIYVTLKPSVLDPQGKAVRHALHKLGYEEAGDVRVGKFIEIALGDTARDTAATRVRQMCEKLLANTVIERYRFDLVDEDDP